MSRALLVALLLVVGGGACANGQETSEGDVVCGPNDSCTTTSTRLLGGDSSWLLVCLDASATPDDREALFARASVASATGVGTDLVEGVISLAARSHGIAVELEPSITTEQREALIAVLDDDPVIAVTASAADCP